MKVSILMAVYNGENYLEEAVDSVFSQDYPNIELVVCDDGSTDATGRLLSRYEGKRPIILIHEKHVGKVHAFNKAFEACTGDAICFLAHDDVLPPNSVRERVTFLKNQMANAIYCNGFTCNSELNPISTLISHPETITWEGKKAHICRNNFIPGGSLLITREIAKKVFPIPEHLLLEDWWVVFNTLYYSERIQYLEMPLFLYRLHEKNDTGLPPTINFDAYLRNHWRKHIDYYDELLKRLNLFDIPDTEREDLSEIIRINKQIVANTLEGKYSFPSLQIIKATGMPKYLCSQVTIPYKAHLFVPLFNFIRKISG